MTVTAGIPTGSGPAEFALTPDDSARIEAAARDLCGTLLDVDDPRWVAAARSAWEELPPALRRAARAYRRDSGPTGALLIRGLPVDATALPPTPTVKGSVQREASVSAAVLLMMACGLGDPAAFRAEKSGALVQDVVPVPGQESFQGNAGSVALMMHNENAFHGHRPDHVMLLCLRADPESEAGLRTAGIREALPLLPPPVVEALSRPEFSTQPPPSFGARSEATPHHPALFGDPHDPDVRVDFAATSGVTPRAEEALHALEKALDDVSYTIPLAAGDLAIVDNRVTLHGRTAFSPRYDGNDRWLQRTFVLTDLRRSRGYRPQDGYILSR
ncbi:clavaminate synthase family protein [Streptomyces sp. LaPpAH-108]|uniref:clavaminate synthase family protein n=1 Tax=Streptomyces sp. LaPpAH-108 TaxID=1155714 RepID=UPI00035F3277|nr:clavaminate synthase family protein [Streptomyces sp. LaPpAH-108]